ncbi:hypothetical protein [Candidatus Methanarcanum hacksteinii]|uniref:hypothetical protein n=1 Tax=Candidatus Methanarcanum hacksteinii TaxID=2911857 RepID=UPI0037DD95DB
MRGTKYSDDRKFTDTIHNNLAIPVIYAPLGWEQKEMDPDFSEKADIFDGIDYFFVDKKNNRIVTTQERFRSKEYQEYSDFTIRFEREYNPHKERKLSEYYKLKADYFVYGTIDVEKNMMSEASSFLKYAVVDLDKIKILIDEGKIVIDRNLGSRTCKAINGVMHCPVNYNKDRSSSFFPIDIKLLIELFPNDQVVLEQDGFIEIGEMKVG